MSKDIKRVRTFLAYKGFQWEPLSDDDASTDQPMDFKACQQGVACFCGSMVVIGKEQPWDGQAIRVVTDEDSKSRQCSRLADQLKSIVNRLNNEPANSILPNTVVVVNHDPAWRFDDLATMIEAASDDGPLPIHLYIWFDDYRSDHLLYSQLDQDHYQKLHDWFRIE